MSAIFDAFTDFIAVFPNGNLTYFTQCITRASDIEVNQCIEYTHYILFNNLLHFSSLYEYSIYYNLVVCVQSEYNRRYKKQLSSDAAEYVPISLSDDRTLSKNRVLPLNNNSANILPNTSNHTNINKNRKNKKIKIKPH